MKTIIKQIRLLTLLLTIMTSIHIYAQKITDKHRVFVRIYNLEGKKISKGKIIKVSDTLLELKRGNAIEGYAIKDIGMIKTKRSAGHNILIGAISGVAIGAIIGASSADPDAWLFSYSASEGAATFGLLGGVAGAGAGGITALFKKPKTFLINGDFEAWKTF